MYVGTIVIIFILGTSSISSILTMKHCDRCLIIDECSHLKKMFKLKPYSAQSYDFYRTIACGFDNFQPKVCCDENVLINLPENKVTSSDMTQIDFKTQSDDRLSLESSTITKIEYMGSDADGITLVNESCDKYTSRNSKIVGGITAALGMLPWMAKLGYTGSNMMLKRSEENDTDVVYRCGGALFTRRHVLTAAHCIVQLPKNMILKVIVLNADGDADFRKPALLLPHPKFNSPLAHHDLGIIKMNRPAEISNNVMPICLPVGAMSITPARLLPRSLIVAGWGSSIAGSKAMTPRLRYARLTYLDEDECRRSYKEHFNLILGDGHLCTVPDSERDACSGDSGGPLFAWAGDGGGSAAVALAIVSFGGKQCAARDVPGVYTRIDAYVDWIQEAVTM